MKNKKKLVLFLAISAVIAIGLWAWHDEALFTTVSAGSRGKANVIFVQDHTGSMSSIIYHPDYDAKVDYSSYTDVTLLNETNWSGIKRTSWYLRWFIAPTTISATTKYVIGHTFTSTGATTGTLQVGSEGVNFKVGDWILQYNSSAESDINSQACAKITAISAPDSNRFFTLTLTDIKGTFVHNYRLYVWASTAAIPTSGYNSTTKVLQVTGDLRSYFAANDYILLFDKDNVYTTASQATARISVAPTYSSSSGRTSFTLADINGTITVTGTQDSVYYRQSAETKLVKLYGSTIDQTPNNVTYAMEPEYYYLRWIFGVANASQRQQVTNFSTLAYDIEYNGYLRASPVVRPDLAFALNPDNSNSDETLLAEWNRVMKDLYPNKIANVQDDPMTSSTTTIHYSDAKATFRNYTTGGFYIKIGSETMRVTSHTPNTTNPDKADEGVLVVTRGQNNTVASAHPFGSAIMIYNSTALGIDEFTPEVSLFSSLQYVDEATGDRNTTWTESKTADFDADGDTESKTCYRYKRVFTRIQVAREAICDVITAKNKLLPVATTGADIDDTVTSLTYLTPATDFLLKIAPFYIKVDSEIMKVTAHDPATFALTVTRAQQGTAACAHIAATSILTFSGARDLVRFGVFKFSSNDSPKGKKIIDLNDFGQKNANGTYKTTSYINSTVLETINAITADGGTPLATALAYVWNYLKPNTVSGSAPANYISSNWKAVDQTTFGAAEKYELLDDNGDGVPETTHPKGSPIQYWCQDNYAVMITDGEANDDGGLTSLGVFSQTSQKTTLAAGVLSDFFKFDYNNSGSHNGPSRWGDATNDGSQYLPDVAYFLNHQDMFPTTRVQTGNWDGTNYIYSADTADADTALYNQSDTNPYKEWPGNQNIKTYTVGLCVTNTVLPKAAKNGDGKSFTAQNYRDLTEAFLSIITSVKLAQEPMSYTTYAAPKQSITEGKYGYIAHFVPREKAIWEGHLRRYRLGDDGAFPSNIDDPDDTVTVKVGETMTTVKSFQWDAATILEDRTAERVVYTSKPSGSTWPSAPINFMTSAIEAADLGVTTPAEVTAIKKFTQNYTNSSGVRIYPKSADQPALLGETFHFNPQLVGYPLAWKGGFDASYNAFYKQYSDYDGSSTPRAEVVYTGANDGKLHCFQSQDDDDNDGGTELWSYVPYELLKNLKDPLVDPMQRTNHTYFIDGKSLVKDIKVGTSGTYTDWKTGLFFGLGIGGQAYCALDITNPNDMKVLWETQYSAKKVSDGYMGYTEAKPVIVNMNGGSAFGKFTAAILSGGYNDAESQATDPTLLDYQRREGKGLYILNANTGALIKKFVYGADLVESGNASTGYTQTNPGFLTAMTAAPAVLDKNNDGYADVIYLAESGDYRVTPLSPLLPHGAAIWKIKCNGNPSGWTAKKIFQAPAGQTIYVSPSLAYDTDFRVWVMFGTGRRPWPAMGTGESTGFTNLTGQFVAFIDDDSSTPKTISNLHNAASAITSGVTTTYDIEDEDTGVIEKGFYYNFLMNHEIMFEPQPLYVNNKVYFMTFIPATGTGSTNTTVCGGTSSVNGIHYIYQFTLTSMGNTFTIGDVLHQSGKILGYGPIDEEFTIYVGEGTAGNFKSDESERIRDSLVSTNSALLWKEDKK